MAVAWLRDGRSGTGLAHYCIVIDDGLASIIQPAQGSEIQTEKISPSMALRFSEHPHSNTRKTGGRRSGPANMHAANADRLVLELAT